MHVLTHYRSRAPLPISKHPPQRGYGSHSHTEHHRGNKNQKQHNAAMLPATPPTRTTFPAEYYGSLPWFMHPQGYPVVHSI